MTSIPVNKWDDDSGAGVTVDKMSLEDLRNLDEATFEAESKKAHREDRHSFFLLDEGTVTIEIDFKIYKIKPRSIVYMHPDQVHRILAFENIMVSSWALENEKLHPEYLKLLEDITPAKPLQLKAETYSIISETVSLCLKFAERKSDKMYHSLLQDGCNALVALVLSRYAAEFRSAEKLSRFEMITRSFREMLEQNYTTIKRPAAYAQLLNISTPYLNECVKNATGYPVSYHIQQRVILEAKRLLYHSDRSVKEIAAALGYDDYPHFSQLFTKVAGMTALTFRNKNLG